MFSHAIQPYNTWWYMYMLRSINSGQKFFMSSNCKISSFWKKLMQWPSYPASWELLYLAFMFFMLEIFCILFLDSAVKLSFRCLQVIPELFVFDNWVWLRCKTLSDRFAWPWQIGGIKNLLYVTLCVMFKL